MNSREIFAERQEAVAVWSLVPQSTDFACLRWAIGATDEFCRLGPGSLALDVGNFPEFSSDGG